MTAMDCYSHTAPRQRKLTHEQVRQIADLYEQGCPVGELARRFGMAQSAISYRLTKTTVLFRDRAPAERQAMRERRAHWRDTHTEVSA